MLQRSAGLFSTGVPVTARRQPAGMRLTVSAFCVVRFLMFWASSSTTMEKPHRSHAATSRRSSA